MKIVSNVLALLVLLLATVHSNADQIFSQPPNPAGGQYKSAWYPPDGLDGDMYCYDNFTLAAGAAINEIRWRVAYTNYLSGVVLAGH